MPRHDRSSMFEFMGTSIEHVRNAGLRPLGVTSAMRSQALPNVPTVGELLPGYEASSWLGIAAPKQTPADIVDRLNREINAALVDPSSGSSADFANVIAADTEKWGKVISAAKIRAG
jgi:tripartite-type tricarboxylate transporter receptor subunit TctC